jgi:hypothetical protein
MLITEKRKYHMASFSSDEENPFIPLLYHNGALNFSVKNSDLSKNWKTQNSLVNEKR